MHLAKFIQIMEKQKKIATWVLIIILLFPSISFAHSPGGYIVATFSIVVISSILSALAKKSLLKFVSASGDQLKFKTYVLLAISETLIMVLSVGAAIKIDISRHSLAILGIACTLYFVIALFLHYFILRNTENAFIKSMQATVIFPIFIWACAFTIFVPLYVLFGG